MIFQTQGDLFSQAGGRPEGLDYGEAFLAPQEQVALAQDLDALDFRPFEFRGVLAKRQVAYFGCGYDFSARRVEPAEPIPAFLLPVQQLAAAFAGLSAADLPHVLVNKYEPGAAIGWHRDRPQFADVIGVSLGAPATFRMRRRRSKGWERFKMILAPGSIYLLRGPSRHEWEHSLTPGAALRYSITFRSLRDAMSNSR